MQVGECYRCNTTIEPLVSRQWFVRMKPLAKPALAAVREGIVQFVPERFAKVYLHWVENVKDWCISRQIWWGHTLPVWYCECSETIVSADAPTLCPSCHGHELTQETDVLDTWFSSALWPFETLGWPDESSLDLKRFFPTQVLVTGYDIIYFWVARMVFMSYELTGRPPFSHVLIHGLVRDAEGKKMSKSLGNGIDPMAVVDSFGADTLRFTLLSGNTPGNDMRFYQERLEATRSFCNKVWNAARFVLLHLQDTVIAADELPSDRELTLADRYILAQLHNTATTATRLLEQFEFGEGAKLLYEFLWSEYCDWYIEMAKPALQAGGDSKKTTLRVLCYALSRTLELLHPFMPFITEEIWQALPHRGASITVAPWPETAGRVDVVAQTQVSALMEAIRAIRNIRAEMGVAPSRRVELTVVAEAEWGEVYKAGSPYLLALAGGKGVKLAEANPFAKGEAVSIVVTGAEIHLALSQLVDIEAEVRRLQAEQSAVCAEIDRARGKLQNEGFRAKAPAALIAAEDAKLAAHEVKLAQLEKRLAELQ
ncbi:MAG: Valine--tRNA ligase [Firmicutes bacterium]|nr:Valine--tRNA ligase [candidate division NPL-UPA2 bacterium]